MELLDVEHSKEYKELSDDGVSIIVPVHMSLNDALKLFKVVKSKRNRERYAEWMKVVEAVAEVTGVPAPALERSVPEGTNRQSLTETANRLKAEAPGDGE